MANFTIHQTTEEDKSLFAPIIKKKGRWVAQKNGVTDSAPQLCFIKARHLIFLENTLVHIFPSESFAILQRKFCHYLGRHTLGDI